MAMAIIILAVGKAVETDDAGSFNRLTDVPRPAHGVANIGLARCGELGGA
jgi:hypothetical protein